MNANPPIAWDQLQHACGEASDVPSLLEKLASARGEKHLGIAGELCSRVLDQGTIYSASPPVVAALIEMLPTSEARERAMLYSLLSGFAEAARIAIKVGRAIPCCAGGDPADGTAIQQELQRARNVFAGDLAHRDATIRGEAGGLLTAFAGAEPEAVARVRDRYLIETDDDVRRVLIEGLVRTRERNEKWTDFLKLALERETTPGARFLLRQIQVIDLKAAASEAVVEDLIAMFVQSRVGRAYSGDDEPFFEAARLLGPEREFAAVFRAFEMSSGDLVRTLV